MRVYIMSKGEVFRVYTLSTNISMNIYGALDSLFFACIGFIVLGSCIVYIKKCKRDMHRIRVVPAVLVEPYVPELP